MLQVADIRIRTDTPTMSSHPSSTAPSPLHHHSQPALQVCLIFGFFAMLMQSNLVPLSAAQFEPLLPTCRGGRHHGSSRSSDSRPVDQDSSFSRVGASHPHPVSAGTPSNPVTDYCLLTALSTTSPDQPLVTYLHQGHRTMVMIPTLSPALVALLHDLGYDTSLFSLHSLHRGGGGGVHGGLLAGLGLDRHQTSGTVDQ